MSLMQIRRGALIAMLLLCVSGWLSCEVADNGISDFAFSRIVAYAGEDRAVVVHTLVVLDGSSSKRGAGDELSYSWSQLGGPVVDIRNRADARATVAPVEPGEYLFELSVTDQDGTISSDQIAISVLEPGVRGAIGSVELAPALAAGQDPLVDLLVEYAAAVEELAGPAKDDQALLQITNLLKVDGDQYTIRHLYLAPVSAAFWGRDLVADSAIEFGQSRTWSAVSGLYDLRAVDERDYEYRSRLELGQVDDRWEITSAASATDPLAVARAKKLIAQLKLCFARDGVEYAYLYDLRPFVERDPATNEYLVRGTSLSDDAAVSAVFVPATDRYALYHTHPENARSQYRFVFDIIGDRLEGAVELRHRDSAAAEYTVVSAAALLPNSRIAAKKIR